MLGDVGRGLLDVHEPRRVAGPNMELLLLAVDEEDRRAVLRALDQRDIVSARPYLRQMDPDASRDIRA